MKRIHLISLLLMLLALSVQAQDDAPPTEEPSSEQPAPVPTDGAEPPPASGDKNVFLEGFGSAIPTPYPADRYSATWEKNPFLIVVTNTPPPPDDFSKDWALTGLTVRPSGEATAYIRNKQTQEFKRITSDEDKDGFKLLEANPNPDRKVANVKVAKGSETATLQYDETMTAPAPAAPRVPVPGQPQPGGVQPGRPVIPTPGGVPAKPGVPQPGVAQPQGVPVPGMPVPNANPGTMPTPAGVRSPTSRRRILIPPPIPQGGAQQPVPAQ